jgi:hypothetical protein
MRDPPERNGKADRRSLVNVGDALQLLDKSDSNIPIHPKFILAFPRKQDEADSSIGEYDVQNWEEDRLERLISTLATQEYKWSPCISSSIASNAASHPLVARFAINEDDVGRLRPINMPNRIARLYSSSHMCLYILLSG